ncbi:hypothetical protein ACVIW2_000049 [Bradyrhizobium huanghuaihaiense]
MATTALKIFAICTTNHSKRAVAKLNVDRPPLPFSADLPDVAIDA